MADLIRSAKPPSDWTDDELQAYNIRVVDETPREFFGRDLSANIDSIDPQVFNNVNQSADNRSTRRVLNQLKHVGSQFIDESTNFTAELLRFLGFDELDGVDCVLSPRFSIPLHICEDTFQTAESGISLLSTRTIDPTVALMIQEDVKLGDPNLPEPQLLAKGIAAAQLNNTARQILALPEKDMIIPGIAMLGLRPVFYQIHVTQELSQAVIMGDYPAQETVVRRCIITGDPMSGMENPEFRRRAVKHYLLFRDIVRRFADDVFAP